MTRKGKRKGPGKTRAGKKGRFLPFAKAVRLTQCSSRGSWCLSPPQVAFTSAPSPELRAAGAGALGWKGGCEGAPGRARGGAACRVREARWAGPEVGGARRRRPLPGYQPPIDRAVPGRGPRACGERTPGQLRTSYPRRAGPSALRCLQPSRGPRAAADAAGVVPGDREGRCPASRGWAAPRRRAQPSPWRTPARWRPREGAAARRRKGAATEARVQSRGVGGRSWARAAPGRRDHLGRRGKESPRRRSFGRGGWSGWRLCTQPGLCWRPERRGVIFLSGDRVNIRPLLRPTCVRTELSLRAAALRPVTERSAPARGTSSPRPGRTSPEDAVCRPRLPSCSCGGGKRTFTRFVSGS